jgi:hypothetical protein
LDVSFTAQKISHGSHLFDLQALCDGLNIAFTVSSDDHPNAIRVISKKGDYKK